MKILITGICGFVGSSIARTLLEQTDDLELVGLDNFIRPGSETNRAFLKERGVKLFHGDIRQSSDLEPVPGVDWVIDAAANPSVLAGVDGRTSSRQLVEHNLLGTVNLLEYCRRHGAGFVLLSTSRVYSIPGLAGLKVEVADGAFAPRADQSFPDGLGTDGVSESYSTAAPVSLYGATKVASESLALEYGNVFDFPVWINRCGVLAGGGQFGRPDQGIFSYWLNSWRQKRGLRYIGFDGQGHQVRDMLHPRDLTALLIRQLDRGTDASIPPVLNVAGGRASSMSLRQLSNWCADRWGEHPVETQPENRPFDIPWMVLDSTRVRNAWGWVPETGREAILEEIAIHAEAHPEWLDLSAPF